MRWTCVLVVLGTCAIIGCVTAASPLDVIARRQRAHGMARKARQVMIEEFARTHGLQGDSLALKLYGKYCGPGHPGKARDTRDQPKDYVDWVCRRHDLCYERELTTNPDGSSPENYYFSCVCNREMVQRLRTIPSSWTPRTAQFEEAVLLAEWSNQPKSCGFWCKLFGAFAREFFDTLPCACFHTKNGAQASGDFTWDHEDCVGSTGSFLQEEQKEQVGSQVGARFKIPSKAFCSVLQNPTSRAFYKASRFRSFKAVVAAVTFAKKIKQEVENHAAVAPSAGGLDESILSKCETNEAQDRCITYMLSKDETQKESDGEAKAKEVCPVLTQ